MARIAGINIPDNKPIRVSLTYIYGIGETRSKQILKVAGIDAEKKAADLSADELNKIREFIEKNYRIEGDLRRDVIMSIRRLRDIGCWRGNRHAKRLPVRGQRTKTNNRTIRGNVRKTVTSGRKPAATPT